MIIHGDCLIEMDKLIEQGIKIDAIIADIPYGTSACKWDIVIPFNEIWKRLNKLIKLNGAIVLFGSEPFSSTLRMSNIKNYKYDWVWDKNTPGNPFLAKIQPLKTHENIIVFNSKIYFPQKTNLDYVKQYRNYEGKGEAFNKKSSGDKIFTKRGKYPKSIITISNANKKGVVHPTQKPLPLMEYLVKTYTNEGDLVLDFTAGSGTTGLACKNLNRKFIVIEKEEKYIKLIKDRIGKYL